MARRMRLPLFALLAAVGLCMASSADVWSMGGGGGGGGAMFGAPSDMATTQTPNGFSHGRKSRKVGWHHGTRPPGLRR
jgi:hypothetical protein